MKIIGITGTSGSGKTTVSELIEKEYLAKIINADKVVREMSVPGTEYMNAIKSKLGKEIFFEDGNLNRKLLAEKIYQNKESLELLNTLTFKYVVNEIKKRVINVKNDVEFIVIDAPLLIESGLDKLCDYIIAVIAKEEIKIQRICKRDGLSLEIAKKRLQIQKEDEFYIRKSDFVISNNEEEKLEEMIREIIEQIKK